MAGGGRLLAVQSERNGAVGYDRDAIVGVPFNQSTAAAVTSTRTYLFLSAVVTGTAEAIAPPRVGALFAVIVLSVHEL